jgi:uncharacterized protein
MYGDFDNGKDSVTMEAVPLFPLPNVVLFPSVLLPLHIFEERYKAMIADALAGQRQIAMALLSPGWAKCYYGRPAIEPVVCIGTIVSCRRMSDGKFNILLRGQKRAKIDREFCCHASKSNASLYRTARLTPLSETDVMEIDLSPERQRLESLLTEGWLAKLPLVREMVPLLRSPTRTADLADLVAFHLLDDVSLKQSILADRDVRGRVNRLLGALNNLERPMVDQILHDSSALADPTRN